MASTTRSRLCAKPPTRGFDNRISRPLTASRWLRQQHLNQYDFDHSHRIKPPIWLDRARPPPHTLAADNRSSAMSVVPLRPAMMASTTSSATCSTQRARQPARWLDDSPSSSPSPPAGRAASRWLRQCQQSLTMASTTSSWSWRFSRLPMASTTSPPLGPPDVLTCARTSDPCIA